MLVAISKRTTVLTGAGTLIFEKEWFNKKGTYGILNDEDIITAHNDEQG